MVSTKQIYHVTSQRDKDLDRMSECGKDDSFQKAKEFLEHFIKDLKDFLKRFVRTDQTYIFHITMKEESEWWKHINSYLQKKLKQFHLSTSGSISFMELQGNNLD